MLWQAQNWLLAVGLGLLARVSTFAVAWMKIAMAVSLPNDRYLGFNQIQTCTFSAASCKLSFVSDQLNPRRGIGRCISEMSTWLLSD